MIIAASCRLLKKRAKSKYESSLQARRNDRSHYCTSDDANLILHEYFTKNVLGRSLVMDWKFARVDFSSMPLLFPLSKDSDVHKSRYHSR